MGKKGLSFEDKRRKMLEIFKNDPSFFHLKDIEKLGVTPLSDSDPSEHYYYQILVFTGQRKDAQTKSKVNSLSKIPNIISLLIRFILFFTEMMIQQIFEHFLLVHQLAHIFNVVQLIHLL